MNLCFSLLLTCLVLTSFAHDRPFHALMRAYRMPCTTCADGGEVTDLRTVTSLCLHGTWLEIKKPNRAPSQTPNHPKARRRSSRPGQGSTVPPEREEEFCCDNWLLEPGSLPSPGHVLPLGDWFQIAMETVFS